MPEVSIPADSILTAGCAKISGCKGYSAILTGYSVILSEAKDLDRVQ
jgi:hypothetical protein